MAKKKITGKTRLSEHIKQDDPQEGEHQESAPSSQPAKQPEKLNLIPKKRTVHPTSFRLGSEDKQRLKEITKAVDELSENRKISDTMILKALINNASKTRPDRVLSMVKDILLL